MQTATQTRTLERTILLVSLLLPGPLLAQGQPLPEPASPPADKRIRDPIADPVIDEREGIGDEAREWEVGLGVVGGFGAVFLSEPKDKTLPGPAPGSPRMQMAYPGFVGFSGGGGLVFNPMYRGAIGLEIDVVFSSDYGTGQYVINLPNGQAIKYDVEMGQIALHVPLLVRAELPFGPVRPFLLVGPEFIFPFSATTTVDRNVATEFDAKADFYTALAVGLGVDFKLPIPGHDLRIPFTVGGTWAPGISDKLEDRISDVVIDQSLLKSATLESQWEFQALARIGLVYYML